MAGPSKTEVRATGFAPHIEELHEFFRARGVAFGAPEDVSPFVERLEKDASFHAEMASMVRAIIYRERDGLTPAELVELLVMAVAGTGAEDAPEQVRDAVRQMMGFVAGVFRSRWNPGHTANERHEAAVEDVSAAPTRVNNAAVGADQEAGGRPVTPIFYRAQVVANGGEEPEGVLPLRNGGDNAESVEKAAAREVPRAPEVIPEAVASFLRGEASTVTAPVEPERRRSRGWTWVAFLFAVIAAFCSGMLARQWMLTRGVAWPSWVTGSAVSREVAPAAAAPKSAPSAGGRATGLAARPSPDRRAAQVEAARSEWAGGAESASDLGTPTGGTASSNRVPATAPGAVGSSVTSTPEPMTGVSKPGIEPDTSAADSADARATAMVGASPALMESHLLFAPEPNYPEPARLAHVEGSVVVETLVGRDGTVVSAHAISGQRLLRGAAEEAVYGRRYKPYIVNDIPMAVRTLVTVNFHP